MTFEKIKQNINKTKEKYTVVPDGAIGTLKYLKPNIKIKVKVLKYPYVFERLVVNKTYGFNGNCSGCSLCHPGAVNTLLYPPKHIYKILRFRNIFDIKVLLENI